MRVEVRTQIELDAAIAAGDTPVCIEGKFVVGAQVHVEARGSSHVVARGSSHVEARGSSHVVAWESSHVEAWGSSHVEAWGSSHVEARGASIVRVLSCAAIIASASVTVVIHGCKEKITGGIQVEVNLPETPRDWCAFYGVDIEGETAIVFKGVGKDFRSPHGVTYEPGTAPEASDWDGGTRECGGGLHFSPLPKMTLEFSSDAERFIACPVALADMRAPQPGDEFPHKIKAKKCCAPVWECDRDGKMIEQPAVVEAERK